MTDCHCDQDCQWCGQHEVTASLLADHERECVARPVREVA